MDQTQVLEIGRPIRSNDPMLEARLRDTLASFNISRRDAIRNLLDLHGQNPTLFALAAARVLTEPGSLNSIGSFYLAGLIGRTDAVLDLLLDLDLLNDDQASSLASSIVRVDQLLDIRLMRKMIASALNDAASVPAAVAGRALR